MVIHYLCFLKVLVITCQTSSNYYWVPTWKEVDFTYFKLLNKTLSFDMKINNVGSNMNANLYLIVPIKDTNKDNGKQFICNASGGPNNSSLATDWCSEIDLIECNYYGAAFTQHICSKAGGNSECKTFMNDNISTQNGGPENTGCSQDGCQSKSITKAGKQWFGLDPSTQKPIPNGVDPTQYFTVTTQFTKAGGIITHISQNGFNKVFRMVPEITVQTILLIVDYHIMVVISSQMFVLNRDSMKMIEYQQIIVIGIVTIVHHGI